jgi:hypothetical protein
LHIQELPGSHTGEALGQAAAEAYDRSVSAAYEAGARAAIEKVLLERRILPRHDPDADGADTESDDGESSSSSSAAAPAAALHPLQDTHRRKVWAIVADGCAAEQKGLDHMGEGFFHWQVSHECKPTSCPLVCTVRLCNCR